MTIKKKNPRTVAQTIRGNNRKTKDFSNIYPAFFHSVNLNYDWSPCSISKDEGVA